MTFKFVTPVAAATALAAMFAATELPATRAIAAEAAPVAAATAAALPTDEVVPQFIAKEVVQPVPASTEAVVSAEAAGDDDTAGSLAELIAETDVSALDPELECLAGAIYFEARGEPINGQLAVGEVVVNRANSGRFPATYCGVVKQAGQFSFVRRGHIPTPQRSSAAWHKAQAIAVIAHQGTWDSAAKDSLFFHAKRLSPGWRMQKVASISNHVFYR